MTTAAGGLSGASGQHPAAAVYATEPVSLLGGSFFLGGGPILKTINNNLPYVFWAEN